MADAPASRQALYRVATALEDCRISYAFIGGVAVQTWGLPRQTFDLDVTIALEHARLNEVLDTFERRGFVVDDAFRTGFRDRVGPLEKIAVQIPAGRSLLTVDVFFATTPFLDSVLARRVEVDLGGGPVWVCTAADLILFKLLANRRKDLVDIENILTIQGVPEPDYLKRWAETLGVGERLEEALAEFGAS